MGHACFLPGCYKWNHVESSSRFPGSASGRFGNGGGRWMAGVDKSGLDITYRLCGRIVVENIVEGFA